MFNRFVTLLLILLSAFIALNCSGGSDGPLDRVSAQAVDSDGNPLDGMSVLVNGANSGVTSNQQGFFQVDAGYFTNGVNSVNRLSLGEMGIILASKEIVPSQARNMVFQFPKGKGTPGGLTGYVYDDFTTEPLSDIKLTLFNENLGLYQTRSQSGGYYLFDGVPEGRYRLTARHANYNAGVATVQIEANGLTYQGITLQPKNTARYQDGILVSGYIVNADTLAPIPGAEITMTVDTGFLGMPEPWIVSPDNGNPTPVEDYDDGGWGMDLSMPSPPRYDSQYQTAETDSNGYFEFSNPAKGYGIYLNYWKDGFLSGSEYYDIYDSTDDLVLSLELTPLVMTSANGIVKDTDGNPIKGAYVEFIFAGDEIKYYDGGDTAIGMPVDPGWNGWEESAGDARGGGVPEPPPSYSGGDFGYQGESSPFDNPLMQKYRWENQQEERGGASFGGGFTGFYSTSTNDAGEFTFAELPVGAYYTFVSAYKYQATSGDVTVVEEPSANYFEFTLSRIPVGSVVGKVVDENGAAVANALVNCVQPFIDPFAYTNEQGEYRIDNVPAGDWIVSAFKYGYRTQSRDTFIGEDAEATVNLTITSYVPPNVTTVTVSGRVTDGINSGGIEGARMIFTTADNQFFYDATSGAGGFYSAQLIATEYNVLIQHSEYQDLYMGFYVDTLYPEIDFSLWSIYSGCGPWGGIMDGGWGWSDGGMGEGPTAGGMDDMPAPPEGNEQGGGPNFDPEEVFNSRR